jgi:hypothetical protein
VTSHTDATVINQRVAQHPRAANLDATATERHLAIVVAMTDRGAIPVPLPPRAHDLVDLFLEHLAQHPEPDTHTQREQPLLRCPDQLAERFLDALRENGLIHGRLRDRYGLLHGGSSLDLCGIPANAPNKNGRGRRTAVTSNFYTLRDNLQLRDGPLLAVCGGQRRL